MYGILLTFCNYGKMHIVYCKIRFLIIALLLTFFAGSNNIFAQQQQPANQGSGISIPSVSLQVGDKNSDQGEFVTTLQILAVMTVLSLAPSILIMMTSFTRIIIVFHFLKQAMGTHTQPPNQMLTGLALFLTFFVMQPVLNEANDKGLQPYLREEISQAEAVDNIILPFREFMLKHTREEDLGLFIKLSGEDKPDNIDDVSTWTVIPAFSLSEIRMAFQIGFLLFIPFLVLDMIIASTLMSLGMFLLPPQLISLPIKVLLFILVDGWHLVVDSLMRSITGGG